MPLQLLSSISQLKWKYVYVKTEKLLNVVLKYERRITVNYLPYIVNIRYISEYHYMTYRATLTKSEFIY